MGTCSAMRSVNLPVSRLGSRDRSAWVRLSLRALPARRFDARADALELVAEEGDGRIEHHRQVRPPTCRTVSDEKNTQRGGRREEKKGLRRDEEGSDGVDEPSDHTPSCE
jgi:hypothetical protein